METREELSTNASLKSMETREELSTNCNPEVMSRCLSAPDATSLHHCFKNKQPKLLLGGAMVVLCFTLEVLIGKQVVFGGIRLY